MRLQSSVLRISCPQTILIGTSRKTHRRNIPLWIKSRHPHCKKAMSAVPQKRTLVANLECPLRGDVRLPLALERGKGAIYFLGITPISAAHLTNNRVGTEDSRRVADSTDDNRQQRQQHRLRLHIQRHDMLCAARRQHKTVE